MKRQEINEDKEMGEYSCRGISKHKHDKTQLFNILKLICVSAIELAKWCFVAMYAPICATVIKGRCDCSGTRESTCR